MEVVPQIAAVGSRHPVRHIHCVLAADKDLEAMTRKLNAAGKKSTGWMIRTPVRCPDLMCGAYHGHSPTCSIAPVEYKAAEMDRYYKAWLDESNRHERTRKRLSEMVTLWQGKHALLRHENNQLRRKLRKTPNDQDLPQGGVKEANE